MNEQASTVRSVALPAGAAIANLYQGSNLADAYATGLPAHAVGDAESLARYMFSLPSPGVSALMGLRDTLVSAFGLKTARQLKTGGSKRIGIFKIYASSADEVVMGEDDKHLDFRISVLCAPGPDGVRKITVATVVHCHNRLGRAYIALIAPFHKMIVRGTLRRAARAGWQVA